MLQFFKKKMSITICFLILWSKNYYISAVEPWDFIPYFNQLQYIKARYDNRETLKLINLMIERTEKVISEQSKYSSEIPVNRQIYKNLIVPFLVSTFYDKFKNPETFPKEVKENKIDCKLCLGKDMYGKYWCFILENGHLIINSYH